MAFFANSYEKEDQKSEIQNSVRRINSGHRPCTVGAAGQAFETFDTQVCLT